MNSWKGPDSSTKLCCLIGYPVKQSPSPIMHNAAFHSLGINAVYLAFGVPERKLSNAIRGLRALEFLGANVTMPHKKSVMKLLDKIDAGAKRVNAVNTILNQKGELTGFNTDIEGFANPLQRRTRITDLRALIVGAGGAARACAFALAENGCKKISILNRTVSKAEELVSILKKEFDVNAKAECLSEKSFTNAVSKHNLIVNATPLGMHEKWFKLSIQKAKLEGDTIAYDLVYRPLKTDFLATFEKLGAVCIHGYEMLVEQAALSFEIWTGKKAPKKIMTEAVLESLGAEEK
ncbi:MAG: shikimate dehydrogenase [Thaumarchaeota archaeon]|nr:shikimate dehydrogenase [Nitrososphaerota archaeon]